MLEMIKDIFQAPPATLLMVFGLGFLVLAVIGKISGKIDPGNTARIISGVLGACLLIAGLVMQITSRPDKSLDNISSSPDSRAATNNPAKSPKSDLPLNSAATEKARQDNANNSNSATVFDFVSNAPSATWMTSSGANFLRWGGSDADPQGFALWRDNAYLEDGAQVSRALETHPQWIPNGNIWGDYHLPNPIKSGDRFRATVGFLQGSAGEVKFTVQALGGALPTSEIAKVSDKGYDKELRAIDADLSPVAGATTIRLIVEADPNPGQDWAVWINPRIEYASH
jgi:hypothetical protein